MLVYLRLLKESFGFAMNALRNNKLRTLLSLLGVTIGIFSIIAVLAAVDSLDRKIKSDISGLDNKSIFLFKYCFGPSDIPDWKIDQFPDVNFDEYNYIKNNVSGVEAVCYQFFTNRENIKHDDKVASSVSIKPCTYEFIEIEKLDFAEGRFFNEQESNSGKNCVILGSEIADVLFENQNPIDKEVRLYGQKFIVIGVLKKVGERMINFGSNPDNTVYVPINKVRAMFGDNNDQFTPIIIIRPQESVELEDIKGELTQKLRIKRGLKAGEIDNFFVNVLKGATDQIDAIITQMNIMGWVIAGFSLLVGGFGIANIMFVSVKERTNLIGIQKSLGAKNRFILFQFLFEAVILCVIGGFIGLLLVWLISIALTSALDFEFVLGIGNVVLGTSLAIVIGLISGILPAISASKLDPVEAIRSGM
ncbi:ABC transporter permease [Flavobacterium aquatile]|uniref:ABC transporter permease n=1 Tax=Flavobacterium aquatile LMG 4008 = ATCC 11947 TaxID=1453498 RepID=A0A095TZW2_9FLAO|nr:ABC transporter permease [Flavobacterium aquatile]KGD67938.1 ABC transporter permease [Flavobacterium aquatile LMG 4008 = ATCC 11947]OXA65386.1 ABC transporter permease [Flavobacterium aquatile LMG 4008 = ATCC 11947]GEC78946.1 ABC transporter permease [Flavobacterium aquatile]